MPDTARRYTVSGTDDLDDVHIFRSDDRRRAEEIAKLMREDLDGVELTESSSS